MTHSIGWKVAVLSILTAVASADNIILDYWTGKIDGEVLEVNYTVQVPVTEERPVTYTVAVPYVEEIKLDDGTIKQVTKTRTEERVRTTTITRLLTERRTRTQPIASLDEMKLYKLDGSPLTGMKRDAVFSKPTAVVRVGRLSEITPETKLLLNENVIIQVAKRAGEAEKVKAK